jgi:hypothetical protein
LSLDAVRPRWASIGFPAVDKEVESWIVLLRRCILKAAGTRGASPQAGSNLVADVLAAVATDLGDAACRALVRFGRFMFAMGPSDHPELFAWSAILEKCDSDEESLRALLPWADLSGLVARELRHADASIVREKLTMPLSSWDLAILALRGIDDADDSAAEHPMRLTEWTSRATAARMFWRAILPRFDADRRDALAWNGSRLGWSMGSLQRDQTLPDPSTLIEACDD